MPVQALLGLALTLLLVVVWRGLGWGDAAVGVDAHRKLQRGPVPPVGGVAIALAWLLALLWGVEWLPVSLPGMGESIDPGPVRGAVGAALLLAFGVGFVDDRRRGGVGTAAKLLGQGIAGGVLALPWWLPESAGGSGAPWTVAVGWTCLSGAAAIVAINAWNFFDNADGAATSLAILGLVPATPLLAGAPLGFLVPNLLWRRRSAPEGGPADPLAYLGDSGSHLLGVAMLVIPAAWPALLVPLLDALRVTLLRLSLGEPPWRGDRRHLAHRLQRAGLPPLAVALVLVALALPAVLDPGPVGFGATTLLFGGAVVLTTRHA